MPRSGDEARRRLQQAALELFQERGYDATTTAAIAARAGVTERTFFRHFPDKREALFDGEEAFREALTQGVKAAPEDLGAMQALFFAFRSVGPLLQQNRPFSEPRRLVIAQNPALQERLLTKTAGLIVALTAVLRRRGLDDDVATLASELGMAMFSHAANSWLADPSAGLETHLEFARKTLQGLSTPD